jgi:NAD(P)-dependent dehydrogenase (short-subunit alcohol dehydrogenase family)
MDEPHYHAPAAIRRLLGPSQRSAFLPRTALITGGASGIGLALGRQLARRGTEVTLADIEVDAVRHAAAQLRGDRSSGDVHSFVLDVRDENAFHAAVQAASSTTGTLDALFNNAGTSMGGPTEELTSAHWDRIIDVNLRGVVNGILAAYPQMVERGCGHIVNTASGVGLVAPPFVVAYATTKHAVVGLSTGLRAEAARHGVSVSVLCPGSVETPILDRLPDDDLPFRPTQGATGRDYAGVLGVTPMPADEFARRALRSLARGRPIIVEPRSTRLFWQLHRLSPRLTELVNRRLATEVHQALNAPRT